MGTPSKICKGKINLVYSDVMKVSITYVLDHAEQMLCNWVTSAQVLAHPPSDVIIKMDFFSLGRDV